MCWLRGQRKTGSTPTRSKGPGPTTRCASGSLSTPGQFVAGLRSSDTRWPNRAQSSGAWNRLGVYDAGRPRAGRRTSHPIREVEMRALTVMLLAVVAAQGDDKPVAL